MENQTKPWVGTANEALRKLGSNSQGLSGIEVDKRLLKYGLNSITRQTPIPYLQIFFDQFVDLMVLLLVLASVLSFLLGDFRNGIIIFLIVLLNATIGFVQEFKVEKILRAMSKMLPDRVKVRREGAEIEIVSTHLVPGDIVILGEGDKVPADIRILESYELRIDEQILTGESIPQSKKAGDFDKADSLSQVENSIFMGTIITAGEALGVVAATGHQTEFGKIAQKTLAIEKNLSPLQEKTHRMAKRIAILALVIMVIMIVYQYLSGRHIAEALIFSVAVAAALVPEGLPATVSVALSLGARNLAKKKALARSLVSVETLGSTTVICTDKTGTLTTGKMVVKEVWFSPSNGSDQEKEKILERVFALCNDAEIIPDSVGDPTEIALLRFLEAKGLDYKKIRADFKKIDEIPFNSDRRFMSTVYTDGENKFSCVKGAPEVIAEMCKLGQLDKDKIMGQFNKYAQNGFRVLAVAFNNDFIGLAAIFDPPREEVKDAINHCKSGNIRVIMITGDSVATAGAIAREVGVADEQSGAIIEGNVLEKMSDIELRNILRQTQVFARILPEQKYRIVDNLMQMGEVVAVTGDGVNDAPALKRADIGIAMGLTGSDVSRQAADMVLLDDNFSTIVSAIKEGRVIFDNIKKFLFFIFAHNFGELGIVILGMVLGLPLPMLAVQILAVDLGTDVLPSMALIAEKGDEVMRSKPRSKEVQLLSGESFLHLTIIGLIVGIGAILNFSFTLNSTGNYFAATTVSFTTLAISQAIYVFLARCPETSIFKYPFWKNWYLIFAVLVSLSILLLIIYWPVFNGWFSTAAFPPAVWLRILSVGVVLLIVEELYKITKKRVN